VTLFIGVTAWWLTQDSHVPDYDSGIHLKNAFGYYNAVMGGKLGFPLTGYSGYAPFAELVGSVGRFVGGAHIGSAVLAQNLVFVPLLALGCYQVGRLVANATAGLLAVVFALGAPMIVGEFHEYLLDPPLAALVAVTVWLLLASDRFDGIWYCAAAGVIAGLGMLTKQSYPVYVAGLVLVMLARGGWRNWRGVLVFAAAAAVVAGPWYVLHLQQVQDSGKVVEAAATAEGRNPPRQTAENLSWYVWAVTNRVLLVPLSLFAAAGTVVAAVRFWRTRARDDLMPELVGGLFVSWLLLTFFLHFKDNRYALPVLVYLAVIGTFWIVTLARPWRQLATVAVAVLAAMNFAAVSFGLGKAVTVHVPGYPTRVPDQGDLTFYTSNGWLTGGPERGGDIPGIVEREVDRGVKTLGFEPGGPIFFNANGLAALASLNEVKVTMDPKTLPRDGLFVFTRDAKGRFSRPCVTASDGTPVFFARGGQKGPVDSWALICPKP